MSRETLQKALGLINSGSSDQALDLLRPLVADESSRAYALAAMALCHVKAENFPTAIYLYQAALKLNPGNQQWAEALRKCEANHQEKKSKAEAAKLSRWPWVISLFSLILGGVLLLIAVPGPVGDLLKELTGIDAISYMFYILPAGAIAILGALVAFLSGIRKRIIHHRAIRSASGENYEDQQHKICWRCKLRYLKNMRECPFCGASRKAPGKFPLMNRPALAFGSMTAIIIVIGLCFWYLNNGKHSIHRSSAVIASDSNSISSGADKKTDASVDRGTIPSSGNESDAHADKNSPEETPVPTQTPNLPPMNSLKFTEIMEQLPSHINDDMASVITVEDIARYKPVLLGNLPLIIQYLEWMKGKEEFAICGLNEDRSQDSELGRYKIKTGFALYGAILFSIETKNLQEADQLADMYAQKHFPPPEIILLYRNNLHQKEAGANPTDFGQILDNAYAAPSIKNGRGKLVNPDFRQNAGSFMVGKNTLLKAIEVFNNHIERQAKIDQTQTQAGDAVAIRLTMLEAGKLADQASDEKNIGHAREGADLDTKVVALVKPIMPYLIGKPSLSRKEKFHLGETREIVASGSSSHSNNRIFEKVLLSYIKNNETEQAKDLIRKLIEQGSDLRMDLQEAYAVPEGKAMIDEVAAKVAAEVEQRCQEEAKRQNEENQRQAEVDQKRLAADLEKERNKVKRYKGDELKKMAYKLIIEKALTNGSLIPLESKLLYAEGHDGGMNDAREGMEQIANANRKGGVDVEMTNIIQTGRELAQRRLAEMRLSNAGRVSNDTAGYFDSLLDAAAIKGIDSRDGIAGFLEGYFQAMGVIPGN